MWQFVALGVLDIYSDSYVRIKKTYKLLPALDNAPLYLGIIIAGFPNRFNDI